MVKKSVYVLTYFIGKEEDTIEISVEIKMSNLIETNNKDIYVPIIKINGYITDEYNEIARGTVNAKYCMEEIVDIYKRELKKRSKKLRKNFKIVKERYK